MSTSRLTASMLALVGAFVASACSSPPGTTSKARFTSANVSAPGANTTANRYFFTTSISVADLATTYGDVNTSANSFTAGTFTEQTAHAPAIAACSVDNYLMAYSMYDQAYATATAQSVFAATPTTLTSSYSWPTTLGGFTYLSPSAAVYNSYPSLTQQYGGSGLLTFLGSAFGDGTADYTLYAWARNSTTSTWIGSAGGSAAPQALTTAATNRVNNRAPGLCMPASASDYAGGFLTAWCGPDNGADQALTYARRYTPHGGWWAAPSSVFGAAPYGANIQEGLNMSAGVAPLMGQGVAVAFNHDGTQNGWVAQVTSTTPATPTDFNLRFRYFYGSTQTFTAADATETIDGYVDADTTNVLFSPVIFPESSSFLSIFYASAVAGAATGSLYHYCANISDSDSDGDNDTAASGSCNTTALDTLAFDGTNRGEYEAIFSSRSPDGSKGALLYASASDTIRIRRNISTGSWSLVKEYSAPISNITIKHGAIAIDDTGDMLIAIAVELPVLTDAGVVLGFYYNAGTNSWSSTYTNLTATLVSAGTYCHSDYLRVSAALDNNNRGMVGFSCLPVDGAGTTTGNARQYFVPYR